MIKEKRLQLVQNTEKTLCLLEVLVGGNPRLCIHELSSKINCSHNETLLLLITLESKGLVKWDDVGKVYRQGDLCERLAWKLMTIMGRGGRALEADLSTKKDSPEKTAIKKKRQVKQSNRLNSAPQSLRACP